MMRHNVVVDDSYLQLCIIQNILQVTDGENTSRTALRIVVEDVNDNAPQFEEQFYLINIAKDVELGSTIAKIRANDPDTGLAGTVRYELAANSVKDFIIDRESGEELVKLFCSYSSSSDKSL